MLAANSLSWIGMQTMFVYMIAFAQQRFPALGADEVGKVLSMSFLALNAVAALLPALVLLPLARKFGEVRVHAVSLATMAGAFAGVYLFAQSPLVLYALMALLGIGWAAIVSLPFSIMSQRVDQSRDRPVHGCLQPVDRVAAAGREPRRRPVRRRRHDKGLIFLIGAVSMALSAIAWRSVSGDEGAAAGTAVESRAH